MHGLRAIALVLPYLLGPLVASAQSADESEEGGAPREEALEPTLPPGMSPEDAAFLTPEMLEGGVVVVWGERKEKPFERDTTLRLTGKELAERGATDLAAALELLPELNVREAGRGGRQIDIRGARKGSVKILIDGIPISDPFYGNIDISSIPITDIEQIRVSSTPASPIDGTGGPGGVIEVHTRDAVGTRMVRTQMRGTNLPSAAVSATGRSHLRDNLALRASLTTNFGARQYEMDLGDDGVQDVEEDKMQGAGALRLEYRSGKRRVAVDAWAQYQSFLVPPGSEGSAEVLFIEGESQGRLGLSADDSVDAWRLQGRAFVQRLERESTFYTSPAMDEKSREEDIRANRLGVALLANRRLGDDTFWITALNADRDAANVDGFDGQPLAGDATVIQGATGLQLRLGAVEIDSAIGAAVPIGLGAEPWPEAKFATTWHAAKSLETKLTLAQKGRVPTLRERFRVDIGNAALGPEQAAVLEFAIVARPTDRFTLTNKVYNRRSNGQIRFDSEQRMLINTNELDVRGIETRIDLGPTIVHEDVSLGGGASYVFTDAYAESLGIDPLDFLPRHQTQLWLIASIGKVGGTTARYRGIGSQIDRNIDLEVRHLIDVSAFYEVHENVYASARVDNLLGQDYQMRARVPAPRQVFTFILESRF